MTQADALARLAELEEKLAASEAAAAASEDGRTRACAQLLQTQETFERLAEQLAKYVMRGRFPVWRLTAAGTSRAIASENTGRRFLTPPTHRAEERAASADAAAATATELYARVRELQTEISALEGANASARQKQQETELALLARETAWCAAGPLFSRPVSSRPLCLSSHHLSPALCIERELRMNREKERREAQERFDAQMESEKRRAAAEADSLERRLRIVGSDDTALRLSLGTAEATVGGLRAEVSKMMPPSTCCSLHKESLHNCPYADTSAPLVAAWVFWLLLTRLR